MRKAISIDPRNESYRFNMANIYLANRQPDKAIAILESLQKSTSNQEMASRISGVLENLHQFQQNHEESTALSQPTLMHRPASDSHESENPVPQPTATAITGPKWGAPIFVRGTVSRVDCSAEPSAILNLSSGSKTVQLKIADKAHVILIGADRVLLRLGQQEGRSKLPPE